MLYLEHCIISINNSNFQIFSKKHFLHFNSFENIMEHGKFAPHSIFGTRDLFNISYSRELYLFSKFLHFEEIVRAKMAVCFEMIVSET